MKKILAILIFLVFIALCGLGLTSCGARHVEKERSKEEIKSEVVDNSVIEKKTDTNVKKTIETKTDDKNETVTEETTYTPEDPTKEAIIIEKDGTKTVLNNTKKTYTKTIKKNNTQSQTNKYVDSVRKDIEKEKKSIESKYEAKKESSAKEVDKKKFNPFVLIGSIAGVLLLLYLIYWLYKKFMLP